MPALIAALIISSYSYKKKLFIKKTVRTAIANMQH